ncbi:MAG: FHA domain-containing protein [Cytophagales bacterium]|nr:FHA domain-containing protein [Armatimonadota bacterium]
MKPNAARNTLLLTAVLSTLTTVPLLLVRAQPTPASEQKPAVSVPAAGAATPGKQPAGSTTTKPSPKASAPASAAPASPAGGMVTQPARPPVNPAGAPVPTNNWGAGVLGLLILVAGGWFGLRIARERGVTVAGSLQKLGVEMPQDSLNGPATISHLKPVSPISSLPPLPPLADLPGVAAVPAVTDLHLHPGTHGVRGGLLGTLGPVEGRRLPTPAEEPLTMGRDPENTLPMPDDSTVSRRHARIEALPGGGGHQIVDEGSSNGTFVNGQRLTAGKPRPLLVGDEIQVGASRLRFEG